MVTIIRKCSLNANAEKLLFSKNLGKCILENAFDVPLESVSEIQENLNNYIYPDNSCDVRLVIDNYYYNCKLQYANPKRRNEPCLQFRYTQNTQLLKKLKQIFLYSYNKFIEKNISLKDNGVYCENILFKSNLDEEFSIYSTDKKDVFLLKYSNVYNELAA